MGTFFSRLKSFFLNNSDRKLKQKIESYAEDRKDGRVMCAVVGNIDSVFPNESAYTIAIKQKHFAPPIRVGVSKDYNFDCIELLSKEEMKLVGVLWFYFGV